MPEPETQWVTPSAALNPAVPATRAHVAAVSRWSLGPIPTVLAFPVRLDEDRVRRAVQVAAGWWPNVCGRYERELGTPNEYYIRFTRSPIPYSTQTLDRAAAYDDDDVVQSSHAPYIHPLSPRHLYPGDEPLLSVRLTHLSGAGSVLGVQWSHLLGDAASAHHFLRHLAHFYAAPDAPPPDPPTFGAHVDVPPADEAVRATYALHQLAVWPAADAFATYARTAQAHERVMWRLSKADVAGIVADAAKAPGEVLSTQDVISAWWAGLMARSGRTVDRVVYTISYRGFHPTLFPPDLGTLSANVTQMRAVPLAPAAPRDTAHIARAIRAAINELRGEPAVARAWIANAAHQIGRAADEDGMLVVLPLDDEVVVNSNLRYDWAIPFAGVTPLYYTVNALPGFLRVFQANGSREPELIFSVANGERAKYDALLAEDRSRWAQAATGGH